MGTETGVDTGPIVADIERSRAHMAVTLETLGDRLAPKKLVARVKAKVAFKVEELKDRFSPVRVLKRKLGSGDEPRTELERSSRVLNARAGERGADTHALPAGSQRGG